jgi:hypothetical protein
MTDEIPSPAATAADAPRPRTGIVWVASYQKSGNTWTRAFLHNLARMMAGEDDEQDINRMGAFSTWENARGFYTDALGFEPGEAHKAQIAAARHAVQRRIADAHDDLVFVKTHHALVHDRGHTTINFAVTSGAVYIVRNPLDVAISFAHHLDVDIDHSIAVMAEMGAESPVTDRAVHEVFGSWSQHVQSWTRKPHRTIRVVRYEDILADPVAVFGGLAAHLRLGASDDQIVEAVKRSSFERLQAQEAEKGFSERYFSDQRFFREGRAGQWRDQLTRSQIDRIVRDHGEQMARFGYLPD